MQKIQSAIETFQKYIPANCTYKISLPTQTTNAYFDQIIIEGFYGGGTLLIEGNGSSNTVFNSDPAVTIRGCSCDVQFDGIGLTGADAAEASTITIDDCPGKVRVNSCAITSAKTGTGSVSEAILVNWSPCVSIENTSVTSSAAACYAYTLHSKFSSHVFANGNSTVTNDANSYGNYAGQGGLISVDGTVFGGGTLDSHAGDGGQIVGGASETYTNLTKMTNITNPANLNADTVTVAELADVVGALIEALVDNNVIEV